MDASKIEPKHDFARKLRQPSLFPRVMDYIQWQRLVRQAQAKGKPSPEAPNWLAPVSINLDLTTACNYLCDHCIDLDILNSGINYAHEKLMASLNHLIERGLRSVILIGGGEPTVYPRFSEVVRFLKENNIQIAIVTNGSNNNVILSIVDCLSKNDWVRLSLDSGKNDTFIRMHNPRKKDLTLEEICSWVPRIRERNPKVPIGFSYIIVWDAAKSEAGTKIIENIDEIVLAAKLARDNRFSYISYKPFLTRYPDGAEVMDPLVMADFKRTIVRIREVVNEAKKFETEDFKVIESTNLKVLEEDKWRDFTCQPKTCHMQAFHQVLSPLGLFNCPAYRGVEKARIADKNAYGGTDEIKATQSSVAAILNRFDAKSECANVTCLYNSANWFIERAIRGELDSAELEALEERFDYFF